MNKTKWGIPFGLMAALCYFSAALSVLVAGALMFAILTYEKDSDLRYNALQAFTFAVVIGIAGRVVYLLNLPLNLDFYLGRLVDFIEIGILVYAGYKVKDGGRANLPFVSGLLEKVELDDESPSEELMAEE